MSELEKEFQTFKEQKILEYPEKASEIQACKTVRELHAVCCEGDETSTETDGEPQKTKELGIVKHIHEIATKEKEDEDDLDEGGESLDSTGGTVPLASFGSKPQTWRNEAEMLDDLFKMETLGKIESTKEKPNQEVIEKGNKATEMIEKLYKSGMESGKLTRAGKDLMRGRFSFEEPEWVRKARNPLGRKKAKEKPVLVESL